MDLPLVKYHMKEFVRLIKQEPNNPLFAPLAVKLEALLNSESLKNVKEIKLIPIIALQSERKRRQAIENLLKQIQKNPDYPDEVKADIAKSHQETIKEYHNQINILHQTKEQET